MQFTISERTIKCTNESLIGDNADYTAAFSFDAEWEGKVKTARFMHGSIFVDKILNNDSCTIPVEVLKQGFIKIGVFTAEMTSTYCEARIRESIKEKNGSPAAPTPDVYAQIVNMIEDMEQQGVPEEVIVKAVEDYLEEHPIEAGITEEECQQIVADYFEAHKAELKGDKGDKGEKGEQGIQGVPGADGRNGIDGHDGVDGTNGSNGADGYTPVRGIDYWTQADIAQIQAYVDGQIGGALNGTY